MKKIYNRQEGFIAMIVMLLILLLGAIIFVYLRVLRSQ